MSDKPCPTCGLHKSLRNIAADTLRAFADNHRLLVENKRLCDEAVKLRDAIDVVASVAARMLPDQSKDNPPREKP